MYTIAGATGRVGSAAAKQLLAKGVPIRALARSGEKVQSWADRGAEVAVVGLGDRAGLAEALAGSDGFFVLLPFNLETPDFHTDTRAMIDSIAGAVADSGVPHVVMLSSAGADLPSGTGPIAALHQLEEALRATGARISALRPGHFQENVQDFLDAARNEGIYPVFADSADVAKPMVATRDVGAVVASTLLNPPAASETVDVIGPRYTDRQVGRALGEAIGRELDVVTIPAPGRVPALMAAGFPVHIAELLAELYDADERGALEHRGERAVRATTRLETTLGGLVEVAVQGV